MDLRSTDVAARCRALLDALLIGQADIMALADGLAPDVVLWTPGTFAASSAAALEALMAQDWDSGPLSERVVTVTNTDVAPPRVIVEWRVSGRFTRPFFVADDVLVEPTGQLVETAGVLVVTFAGTDVVAVHLYHDAFAVLEQLLAP
jgi:hypothetical protein